MLLLIITIFWLVDSHLQLTNHRFHTKQRQRPVGAIITGWLFC